MAAGDGARPDWAERDAVAWFKNTKGGQRGGQSERSRGKGRAGGGWLRGAPGAAAACGASQEESSAGPRGLRPARRLSGEPPPALPYGGVVWGLALGCVMRALLVLVQLCPGVVTQLSGQPGFR